MNMITKIVLIISLATLVTSQLYGDRCSVNSDCALNQNFVCNGETCECLDGHTDNQQRVCKKSYGGLCTQVLDCNIDRFLKCNYESFTCDCQQPEQQTFDNERKSCVSLVGFGCYHNPGEFSLNCVEGAFCDMPIIEGQMHHICTCLDGWENTEHRTCRLATNSK